MPASGVQSPRAFWPAGPAAPEAHNPSAPLTVLGERERTRTHSGCLDRSSSVFFLPSNEAVVAFCQATISSCSSSRSSRAACFVCSFCAFVCLLVCGAGHALLICMGLFLPMPVGPPSLECTGLHPPLSPTCLFSGPDPFFPRPCGPPGGLSSYCSIQTSVKPASQPAWPAARAVLPGCTESYYCWQLYVPKPCSAIAKFTCSQAEARCKGVGWKRARDG